MRVVFVFPPRNTFSTLRTSHLSRTFRPQIHPFTYTPPATLASHAGASSTVVIHRPACDSTTPSHQLNQPQHTPLPLNRVPITHPQVPSFIQDAVSYRTRPIFASPLLSSLNGADLPFLSTIFKVVLTIWSQSSGYEFNVILAPQWRSSSLFPGANASEEIASSTQGRWGEFTVIPGFGRGNIEEKSGGRLGYRECSALNPCSSTVTFLSPHRRRLVWTLSTISARGH